MSDFKKTLLLSSLNKHFGYKSFRTSTQFEAVQTVVDGKNDGEHKAKAKAEPTEP